MSSPELAIICGGTRKVVTSIERMVADMRPSAAADQGLLYGFQQ